MIAAPPPRQDAAPSLACASRSLLGLLVFLACCLIARDLHSTVVRPLPGDETAPRGSRLGELSQRYQAGEEGLALSSVAGWNRKAAKAEVQRLVEHTPLSAESHGSILLAAALLLTHRGILDAGAGDIERTGWELEMAERLVRAAPAPASDPFGRRFYLLAGLVLQAPMDLDTATAMLDRGLRRYEDDPQLLVARGSVSETVAALRHYELSPEGRFRTRAEPRECYVVGDDGSEDGCVPRRAADDAETRYARALALDPLLHEARLRLARTRLLRGSPGDALPDLSRVASESSAPPQRYLARLFEGQAYERLGDLHRAIAAYEAATREQPGAQAALIALSRALDLAGAHTRAQSLLDRASEPTPTRDPWAGYSRGQPDRIETAFRALRGMIP